jgi:tryptophan-rich sensory protein
VFGIVWTVLYTFMAISLYLLLTSSLRDYYHPWNKVIIVLTMIGYVLNYAYIYAVGCKKDKDVARYVLIVYLMFLPLQILATFEVNALAGILLAPVFGWVVYASTLFEEYV